MDFGDVAAVCVGVSAIIGAAVGLWKLGGGVAHGLRRMGRMLDDWLGEEPRPGLPEGRPGVLAQLHALRELLGEEADARSRLELRVAAIEEQLRPNGGSSFRDHVDQAIRSHDGAGPVRADPAAMGFQPEAAARRMIT